MSKCFPLNRRDSYLVGEARDNCLPTLSLCSLQLPVHSVPIYRRWKSVQQGGLGFSTDGPIFPGFGPLMIRRFFALYHNPTAQIRVNRNLSDPFSLHNSSQQGYLFFPLLFCLSLEPFLSTIKKTKYPHPSKTRCMLPTSQVSIKKINYPHWQAGL